MWRPDFAGNSALAIFKAFWNIELFYLPKNLSSLISWMKREALHSLLKILKITLLKVFPRLTSKKWVKGFNLENNYCKMFQDESCILQLIHKHSTPRSAIDCIQEMFSGHPMWKISKWVIHKTHINSLWLIISELVEGNFLFCFYSLHWH